MRTFCTALMERLQAAYREAAPAYEAETGDQRRPCASCAIQPYGNRAKGLEKTALGFFTALQTGAPFYCHHGCPYAKGSGWQLDPNTASLCAAWWALISSLDRPALLQLFNTAFTDAFGPARPVTDADLDGIEAILIGMVAAC